VRDASTDRLTRLLIAAAESPCWWCGVWRATAAYAGRATALVTV